MDGTEYITLKEAGEISGYSPDYIGQLIRRGKLEGKQVYANVAWVTTKNALEGYLRDKGKPVKEHKESGPVANEQNPALDVRDLVGVFEGDRSELESGEGQEGSLSSASLPVDIERWQRYFRRISIVIIACSALFLVLLFHVFSTLLDDRLERRAFERVSSSVSSRHI